MFDQIKISQLNLDILTEQEKETCVLAVDINSNKNKDKIISKLQQKIAIEIFLQKQVIDYNLVDALRAYFQQIYDLEGLLLTVLLCYQEDMLSKELVTYLKSFLSSQYRGNGKYGYNNPFIHSNKTGDTYINYCSIFFNLIEKIINNGRDELNGESL